MFDNIPALITSFIAMALAILSYFLKKKNLFLILQGSTIVFLSLTCLFQGEYFALISYVIAIARVISYYALEQKDKKPAEWLKALFCFMVILSYVIVNVIIIGRYGWLDILLIVANVLYTYAFAIRNMLLVRYMFLIPTLMSVVYFILSDFAIFVIISYSFEFVANACAIVLYAIKNKKLKKVKKS